MLVGLLSHENADIALDVIELIHELTDEDVGEEAEDDDNAGEGEDKEEALKELINALVRASDFLNASGCSEVHCLVRLFNP